MVPASSARAYAEAKVVGVVVDADPASTHSDASDAPGTPEAAREWTVGFSGVADAVKEVRSLAALALLTSRSRACSCVWVPSALCIRTRSGAGRVASREAQCVSGARGKDDPDAEGA